MCVFSCGCVCSLPKLGCYQVVFVFVRLSLFAVLVRVLYLRSSLASSRILLNP